MEETLVNLFEVVELHPILGADAIELAVVGGWQCVVAKGSMKPGQLVTYISPDSMLSKEVMEEYFPNLKLLTNSEGWTRIKTIRLRGQISQGLVHPNAKLFEVLSEDKEEKLLKKYSTSSGEQGAKLGGGVKSTLPFGIVKTDQENYQSLTRLNRPSYKDELKEKAKKFLAKFINPKYTYKLFGFNRPHRFIDAEAHYVASLKLDGSSMTVCSRANIYGLTETHVCSRNLSLLLEQEGNAFVDEAKKTQSCGWSLIGWVEEQAKANPGMTVVVRGELVGPGIQKNRLNFKALQFYQFESYLDNRGIRSRLNTPFTQVPACVLKELPGKEDWNEKCESLVESYLLPQLPVSAKLEDAEGLVFWNTKTTNCGGISSFKYVFPEYLCRIK